MWIHEWPIIHGLTESGVLWTVESGPSKTFHVVICEMRMCNSASAKPVQADKFDDVAEERRQRAADVSSPLSLPADAPTVREARSTNFFKNAGILLTWPSTYDTAQCLLSVHVGNLS